MSLSRSKGIEPQVSPPPGDLGGWALKKFSDYFQFQVLNVRELNSIIYFLFLTIYASLVYQGPAFAYGKTSRPFVPFQKIKSTGTLRSSLMVIPVAIDYRALKNSNLNAKIQNYRGPYKYREFSFTFDLGAKIGELDYILRILKKHKSRATFFTTGKFLTRYPQKAKEIINDGHEIGNHTFNHLFLQNPDQLKRELIKTERLFYQVTGHAIAPYWRSPYLQDDSPKKKWLLDTAYKIGYIHFNATIDSKDWTDQKNPCYLTGSEFYYGFTKLNISNLNLRNRYSFCKKSLKYLTYQKNFDLRGGIILMHADSMRKNNYLVHQLDALIIFLKKKNYRIVTLTELINDRELGSESGSKQTN